MNQEEFNAKWLGKIEDAGGDESTLKHMWKDAHLGECTDDCMIEEDQ